jgi:hypothetical protein
MTSRTVWVTVDGTSPFPFRGSLEVQPWAFVQTLAADSSYGLSVRCISLNYWAVHVLAAENDPPTPANQVSYETLVSAVVAGGGDVHIALRNVAPPSSIPGEFQLGAAIPA